MKLVLPLALLAFSLPSFAQTAKVIALSPADTAEVKAAYAARDAANKRVADIQDKITSKYLMESKPGSGGLISWATSPTTGKFLTICGTTTCPSETPAEKAQREADYKAYLESEKHKTHLERKQGWEAFEYTEDFRYIVPTPITYSTSNACGKFGVLTGSN